MALEDRNLKFIRQGRTGGVFATILARDPEKIGWKRIFNPDRLEIPKDALILSLVFPGKDLFWVQAWALDNGMYLERTSDQTLGLRYECDQGTSWVQYFGPDSHVKTRRAPDPELLFTVKLPKKHYWKVGFKGVLHLAHASVEHLKERSLDRIWEACFERTRKILGYKPTVEEAAKTTYKQ